MDKLSAIEFARSLAEVGNASNRIVIIMIGFALILTLAGYTVHRIRRGPQKYDQEDSNLSANDFEILE